MRRFQKELFVTGGKLFDIEFLGSDELDCFDDI
jgi:hypothetical protein